MKCSKHKDRKKDRKKKKGFKQTVFVWGRRKK